MRFLTASPRSSGRLGRLAGLAVLLVVSASPVWTQTAGAPSQSAIDRQTPSPPAASPAPKPQNQPAKADAAEKKAMSPEEARQAQLVADTNRLYQLAQELQAAVAKSNKNMLSLAVVRKAAEVEKLAKSLKDRMRSE